MEQSTPVGSRALLASLAFVPAQRPGSQTLAFQWPLGGFVLQLLPVWGWGGTEAGHHKSTCLCVGMGSGGVATRFMCCFSGSQGSDKGRTVGGGEDSFN